MESINNGTVPDNVPKSAFAEHPHLPGVTMQRVGNKVRVMFSERGDSVRLVADQRLYYCDIFEHDDQWTLTAIDVYSTSQGLQTQFAFESIKDRTKVIHLANEVIKPDGTEQPEMDDTAQTLELMEFKEPDSGLIAYVAQGHVGGREFIRAVDARTQANDHDFRYEYAVFRDDESVLFNVRPDAADAKPVTIAYIGRRVEQL